MNITRYRGDTRPDSFTVSRTRPKSVKANLTGFSFKMTLSSEMEPTGVRTQLYQLEGEIVEPESGIVDFSPDIYQADKIGYFYFDVQMTDAQGKIHTLVSGTYEYIQDITK